MAIRIVVNDREITSPLAKFAIIFSTMVVAGLVTAVVIFVILPLVGITVVVSLSFVFAIVAASVAGIVVIFVVAVLYSLIRGSLHLSVDKDRR